MMSPHEVQQTALTYFSMEPDGQGKERPTLWDAPGPGRVRMGVLFNGQKTIISDDPEVIDLAEAYAET